MKASTRSDTGSVLSLDVGERRIGVAVADLQARLPRPLTTLDNGSEVIEQICNLITEHHATVLVVGLPRGLDGQHTSQTGYVETFVKTLEPVVGVPTKWQDEALTSRKAEQELNSRGKPYSKGDIDALSATYILEDFLHDHAEVQL